MPVLAPGRFSITTPWPQISDELLPDDPHVDVGRPAGRERHHDFHGTIGKTLRVLRVHRRDDRDGEQRKDEQRAHRHAPSLRVTSSNSSSTVTFLVIICCFSE